MMQKLIELEKYQLRIFIKESKPVIPFIIILIFQYVMYSIKPLGIVDSFSITAYLLFSLMIGVGHTVAAGENEVMEEILLLRVKSQACYYLSKVIFLIIIGLCSSLVCIMLTVLQDACNHWELFLRPLTTFDVGNGILLCAGGAFLGGEMGSLFHLRIWQDKKLSLVMTFLYAILTIIKVPMEQEIPFFRLMPWAIPPLSQISVVYNRAEEFQLIQTVQIFLLLVFYGTIFAVIRTVLCSKRKF